MQEQIRAIEEAATEQPVGGQAPEVVSAEATDPLGLSLLTLTLATVAVGSFILNSNSRRARTSDTI